MKELARSLPAVLSVVLGTSCSVSPQGTADKAAASDLSKAFAHYLVRHGLSNEEVNTTEAQGELVVTSGIGDQNYQYTFVVSQEGTGAVFEDASGHRAERQVDQALITQSLQSTDSEATLAAQRGMDGVFRSTFVGDPRLNPRFSGKLALDAFQQDVVAHTVSYFSPAETGATAPTFGFIDMPTGTGKTLIALAVVEAILDAQPQKRLLYVASSKALADQTLDLMTQIAPALISDTTAFSLNSPPDTLSLGGKCAIAYVPPGGKTSKKTRLENARKLADFIVFDEVHTWSGAELAANADNGAQILGLTATPWHFDGRASPKSVDPKLLTEAFRIAYLSAFEAWTLGYIPRADWIAWDFSRRTLALQGSPLPAARSVQDDAPITTGLSGVAILRAAERFGLKFPLMIVGRSQAKELSSIASQMRTYIRELGSVPRQLQDLGTPSDSLAIEDLSTTRDLAETRLRLESGTTHIVLLTIDQTIGLDYPTMSSLVLLDGGKLVEPQKLAQTIGRLLRASPGKSTTRVFASPLYTEALQKLLRSGMGAHPVGVVMTEPPRSPSGEVLHARAGRSPRLVSERTLHINLPTKYRNTAFGRIAYFASPQGTGVDAWPFSQREKKKAIGWGEAEAL